MTCALEPDHPDRIGARAVTCALTWQREAGADVHGIALNHGDPDAPPAAAALRRRTCGSAPGRTAAPAAENLVDQPESWTRLRPHAA
jgi:hypothetical protein